MENLCRLCLSYSQKDKLSSMSDKFYTRKIYKYFKIKIKINDILPNQICLTCIAQISKFEAYFSVIKTNQEKLSSLLDCGEHHLLKFYETFSRENLKQEKKCYEFYQYSSSSKKKEMEEIRIDTENETVQNDNTEMDLISEINHDYVKTESNEISDDKINHHQSYQHTENLSDGELETFDKIEEFIDNTNTNKNENLDQVIDNNHTNIKNYVKYKATCQDNFKCECSKIFDERKELFNHFYDEHVTKNAKKKLVQCFNIDSGQYTCKECDKSFGNEVDLKVHLSDHEEIYHPFVCNFCGRAFSTFSKIVRHGRAHFSSYLACSKGCGYKTNYLGALREHEKRHDKEFKYICETCGRGFMVKTWYDQHQNTHTGLKPFQCQYCSAQFSMDKYLKQHIAKVHPHATDVKKYVCVQCTKVCDSKLSLKLHLEEHGIHPAKTFLCDICGKAFKRVDHLRAHKYSHQGTKNHVCSICNKAFLKKYTLNIHEKTHKNVKSFTCSQCNRSFSQNSSLKRHHQRKHSSPSFNCGRCGKGFKSTARLERHNDRCCVKITDDIDISEMRMENRLNRKKKKNIGFGLMQLPE